MWIVELALRRPCTFVVKSILIAVPGVISIITITNDIFPYIKYPGNQCGVDFIPDWLQRRWGTALSGPQERAMTIAVTDIEHMESTSYRVCFG